LLYSWNEPSASVFFLIKQSEIITASASINDSAETFTGLSRCLGLILDRLLILEFFPRLHALLQRLKNRMEYVCPGVPGLLTVVVTYRIFAVWIFITRKKISFTNSAFRVPGNPQVPITFIFMVMWFVVNTLVEQIAHSFVGLLLLLVGIPFYLYWKQQMNSVALSGN